MVAKSLCWVPSTGIYIHRKKKLTKRKFILLILIERLCKSRMYFFIEKISGIPYDQLKCCKKIHAEQWCFTLNWWYKTLFVPQTHLKVTSQWLSKSYCMQRIGKKKLSLPKYLLLPFILNSYLKNPLNLLINPHLIESLNKFRILRIFHY